MSSICPGVNSQDYYLCSDTGGTTGLDNSSNKSLSTSLEDATIVHAKEAPAFESVRSTVGTQSKSFDFSKLGVQSFNFDFQLLPVRPSSPSGRVESAEPKLASIDYLDVSQSAHEGFESESQVVQSTRKSLQYETLPTSVHQDTFTSGSFAGSAEWIPDYEHANSKSGTLEQIDSSPLHSFPSKSHDGLRPSHFAENHGSFPAMKVAAESMATSASIATTSGDKTLGQSCIQGNLDRHESENEVRNRVEAEAVLESMLAGLFCLRFFEKAGTIVSRIDLLWELCENHKLSHQSINALSKSNMGVPSAEETIHTVPGLGSTTPSQDLGLEEVSGEPDDCPSENDSTSTTLSKYAVGGNSSSLASDPPTSSPRPADVQAPERSDHLTSLSLGLSGLSLDMQQNFISGSTSEPESTLSVGRCHKRTHLQRCKSINDLQTAVSTESVEADKISFTIDDDHTLDLATVRDQLHFPWKDHGYEADDEEDDFSSGITSPEYMGSIALSEISEASSDPTKNESIEAIVENNGREPVVSRHSLLEPRERHAVLSFPDFRNLEVNLDGTTDHDDSLSIRKFASYHRDCQVPAQADSIRNIMRKQLTPREMGPTQRQKTHEGLIYIYRLPGEFNIVKIGVTTRGNVQIRIDEWIKKCSHKTSLVYPLADSDFKVVPHAYRVEALVHAELTTNRLKELACSCGKMHDEWFAEELAHARKVVVRWSDWMRKRPYHETESQQWNLKEEHMLNLAALSCLTPRDIRGEPPEASVGTRGYRRSRGKEYKRKPSQLRTTSAPQFPIDFSRTL